ncbi:DUF859 family phage minor structural protein [Priestia aryabhattai]|uniref:DUF859 family phage minor structural protein n=1 Tax=Priestia aryabhattai TaxID=412384 RepID=UPI0039A22D65
MALSGSFYKNIGSGYRLQIEWSATQSIANNTSTITAKLYWMSLSSAYYVNSSSTRDATITINGTSNTNTGATASLSGNQKKLVHTWSYTTGHDSDGTKTAGIGGSFDLGGISLSGSSYGVQSLSQTVTLNTIPRASTLSSSLDWRPPNAFPISINRKSSSFTHTVELHIKRKSSSTWTLINTWTGVGASVGGGFDTADIQKAFTTLAQDSSGDTRVILKTYNGGTLIGSHDYGVDSGYAGGECVVEYSSKLDSTSNANWNIGDAKYISIARNHPTYTHIAKFYVNGALIHTSPTIEYSYTWTPTTSEKTAMYNQTINTNTEDTKIELFTYYNGVQVDVVKNATGTATVVNSNPTFGTGYTYADTNTTTNTVTGNNQYIIQNKSTVLVTLPVASRALPVNSATMKSYSATLAGKTVTATWSGTANVTFDFGVINATSNQTLTIKAIDSRNNSTATNKTVTVIPYAPPVVNATTKRLNGFEATTTITLNGSYAPLTVASVIKNALTNISGQTSPAQYRFKADTDAGFGAWKNFATPAGTAPNYSYANATETLDNAKSYTFEIRVNDKLGMTTVTKTVAKGKPIFFIDSALGSVGISMFPTRANATEIENDLWMKNGNVHVANPTNGTAEAYLGWKSDIARIRVGGTGTGSVNGFQIQGTGDTPMLKLINGQTLEVVNSNTVKLNGVDLQRDLLVPRTVPSMQNSWTTYFGTGYCKTYDGWVMIMGMCQGTPPVVNNVVQDVTIFTLPVGCRPTTANLQFYCHTRGGATLRVDVNMDGTVVVKGGSESADYNTWLSLNGVSFYAG